MEKAKRECDHCKAIFEINEDSVEEEIAFKEGERVYDKSRKYSKRVYDKLWKYSKLVEKGFIFTSDGREEFVNHVIFEAKENLVNKFFTCKICGKKNYFEKHTRPRVLLRSTKEVTETCNPDWRILLFAKLKSDSEFDSESHL